MRYGRGYGGADDWPGVEVPGGELHAVDADPEEMQQLADRWTKQYRAGGPVVHLSGSSVERYLCPDLLRLQDLGAADGWRGHTVRIFFRIMRYVTGV